MSDELPPGWAVATLGEIAEVVGGITKGPTKNVADMREVPYLRVANVQRGHLDLRELKTIRASERDIDKLRLQVGDILFTEGGDRDKLGRGWIWSGEVVECIHQNHIFRARLRTTGVVAKFVSWYANTEGLDYFLSNAKQTTNLASVNMTTLRGLPIKLPPAEEQKRIADKLDALLARVDACRERLDRVPGILKRFRQSVLAAATNGELTREWREDNPAAASGEAIAMRVRHVHRERWESSQLAHAKMKGTALRGDVWKAKYDAPDLLPDAELGELPPGWCWLPLGLLVTDLDQGWSPQCESRARASTKQWAVMKTTAVQPMSFVPSENKLLPAHLTPRPDAELHPGDLLITRAGPRARAGICCHVAEVEPRLMACDKV